MGARVENTQVRENKNAPYQSNDLIDGSHGTDYRDFLSDQRATWQRTWETEVGTTVQNDYETVTQHYIIDYLSMANRDIMVTEDGSWTQRYVYDQSGTRISAEYTHADGTARGTTNADGDYGENFQSDTAVDEVQKVYFRTSPLGSTLFAIDADGETVSHTIYDPWGKPLTETYIDANFSGLDNVNNYTGYTWDEVLGLYYAQNRLYDAGTHRFTQEDPIKSGKNWYAYCNDNPLIYTDAWGLVIYTALRKLAESYALKVTWESATSQHLDRAKVEERYAKYPKIKYYTATNADADGAYLASDGNMYIDQLMFYRSWSIKYDSSRQDQQDFIIARLNELGYRDSDGKTLSGKLTSKKNIEAIRHFQIDYQIGVDGIVGPETWGKLLMASGPPIGAKVYNYDTLFSSLTNSVNNYMSFWQNAATVFYNSTQEAMEKVLGYFDKISCFAHMYGIDVALVQAILFQEIRFYNTLDTIADEAVQATYNYLNGNTKLPPISYRTDSSTGLGQIFAATAIQAYNWYYHTKYDANNWHDLEYFWEKLHNDDSFNIQMVALVLAYNKANYGSSAKTILGRYNGTGDLAAKYADATYNYYLAFQEYNASFGR